jgi:spore germination protein KA
MGELEKKTDALSEELDVNISDIRSIMGDSEDVKLRKLTLHWHNRKLEALLVYIEGLIDMNALNQSIVSALLDRQPAQELPHDRVLEYLAASVVSTGEAREAFGLDAGLDAVLSGSVLLLLDGFSVSLILSIPCQEDRGVSDSTTQPVVKGPQDAFLESIGTNITLVRRRIKDTKLRHYSEVVGEQTRTKLAILYLEGTADSNSVQQLRTQVEQIKLKKVLEGEYIEEILKGKKGLSLFPTVYSTDRPDTVAAGILEGKIAIFTDGTPFVMLLPSFFIDFLKSAEDYYQPFLYSSAIRALRYLAFAICLLAPAVYVALTTVHQDVLPTQLLLRLAAQREGIPFPALMEALIMEITFEILREAGIRMPRTVGQAVSIVGTIVIGQAAVEAGIVSAAMVIIVAITAISSFVIPSYSMSIGVRMTRFLFMFLAASLGIFGISMGILALSIHLCSLQSLGQPYMKSLAPYRKPGQSSAFLRFPFWLFSPRKS